MVLALHAGHYAPIEAVYQRFTGCRPLRSLIPRARRWFAGGAGAQLSPTRAPAGHPIPHRLPIAISSCLLGEWVRFDGRLKRADDLLIALSEQVRWLSFCPEVGSGLSTPRPAMDLFQTSLGVRIRTITGDLDHTDALQRFGETAVARLVNEGVCGAVLKNRSPSCGIGDARLHNGTTATTDGLMVRAMRQALPSLPLVRDEDLLSPEARARFLQRARSYGTARRAHP